MNINELRDEIHKNAIEHGWWEEERSFGEIIALCHSELSEALEEYRKGNDKIRGLPIYYSGDGYVANNVTECCKKPEGIAIELADCIIRILDYFGKIEEQLLTNVDTVNMLTIKLFTFGDFITLWHLYLSKSFEEPYRQIYWLSCVVDNIYEWCKLEEIDIDEAIRIKHEYNKTRPYKHGGKVI